MCWCLEHAGVGCDSAACLRAIGSPCDVRLFEAGRRASGDCAGGRRGHQSSGPYEQASGAGDLPALKIPVAPPDEVSSRVTLSGEKPLQYRMPPGTVSFTLIVP